MEQNRAGVSGHEVDVIVAGAGHNGLVAACYLAKAGLKVLVLEAHSTPGGLTATNPMAPEAPDHMINEASIHASFFRMSPIDQELELSAMYGLRQRVIDPCHVQLNPEGDESIALWRDPRKVAEEMSYFNPADGKAFLEMSELIKVAWEIGLPLALNRPDKPPVTAIMQVLLKAARHMGKLKKLGTMINNSHAGLIEELFQHDMNRAPWTTALPFMNFKSDLSAFAMVYIGILQKYGVSMFEGGTGAFPAALIRCLEANKGEVRCSSPIAELIVRGGRAVGVRLTNGDEVMARKGVITAFSPAVVLNQMLPPGTLPPHFENRAKYIPTATRGIADYKLNIALKGKIQATRHQAWRNKKDGVDLRLPTLQWFTHQECVDAYDACAKPNETQRQDLRPRAADHRV